ncbi:MAG: hypothetical protein ABII75_09525 [Candidatus Omnitrophota bacterium]
MANNKEKISPAESVLVMYSGGVDSTLLAATLPENFKRVYLVTYDLAYLFGLSNCHKNLERLKAIHSHRIISHCIVNATKVRTLLLDTFYDDYFEYCKGASPAIICLACRMAMLMESIKLCLQLGIGHLAIGHTRIQASKAHSFSPIVRRFITFMERYNISYTNHFYDIESRKAQKNLLAKLGINTGLYIGMSSATHQPKCCLGMLSSAWRMGSYIIAEDMERYFDNKIPIMENYLSPYVHLKKGLKYNSKSSTQIDSNIPGRPMHEFGPIVDKILGKILLPFWWGLKLYFYMRKILRGNALQKYSRES